MKKWISRALLLCLAVSLCACTHTEEPTLAPTSQPTAGTQATTEPTALTEGTQATSKPTEPDETVSLVFDLPMTAITMTEQTETAQNSSGDTVFVYTYQNIRLFLPDAEIGFSITLDLLNRIDSTRPAAADMMNDALSASPQYPYSFSIIYTPMRADGTVLSLFGRQTTYSGGSAIHAGQGLSYDPRSGAVLTLEDILVPGTTADTLCPLVIDALTTLPEEYCLFSDYADTVESRFSGNFLADDGWYFSQDSLCFVFAPFEVAPNSTGFVHAQIPYDRLNGILRDVWFPEERITPNGSLEVLPFTQEEADRFDQFTELYLNQVGGSYLLHSTDLIYDLVIESGFWNLDCTVFTPEQTVFYANSLLSSNAVLIQTDIPDGMPNLRITYTTNDGTVSVYLSASGEDGSPLLLTF